MRCPACDGDIKEGAWMCPFCERILDASFLGNDITNEGDWNDPIALDPPTDGLDVDAQMIVESLDDELVEVAPEPPTDDFGPVVKEVPSLGAPFHPEDKIDTNILPEEVLPSSSLRPLDPSLLEEIVEEPPVVAPKKRGLPPLKRSEPAADDADAKKREVLARAMARGPVLERRRSGAEERPAPAAVPVSALPPLGDRAQVEVIVRSAKAEKIFQQALEDITAGNLISARTNIKLALTFDRGNDRYEAKLAEIEQELGPSPSQDLEEVPKGVQFANQFYEKAVEQENQGNFEDAIKLLEKAIRADPQGVYYHRLGTILAFNQGKLKEGRTMVDKAIQRSPRNKNYQKTLSRIVEKMSGGEERRNVGNVLGGLLKRK